MEENSENEIQWLYVNKANTNDMCYLQDMPRSILYWFSDTKFW